ncbi:DUF3837 family protein [Lacrimispora sp.]|uniref:DUF3837 family protein n=1 Tax=Lacrimispora sp. TaxID=2719234 RepID=UPI003FA6146B
MFAFRSIVFYIDKKAIEIKSQFKSIILTSANECCCAIGILAKSHKKESIFLDRKR